MEVRSQFVVMGGVAVGAIAGVALAIAGKVDQVAKPYVVIVGGAVALAMTGSLVISWSTYRRAKRLKTERTGLIAAGDNAEVFAESFSREGVNRRVAIEVYRYLRDSMIVADFPVLPADDLKSVYGIDIDGHSGGVPLGEVIELLWKPCECRDPTDDEVREVPTVITVEDLVKFMNRFATGR